jgi:hypothetical protein
MAEASMKRKPLPGLPHQASPVTFETVRSIARELPGALEGTSYGTPAFKVGGKLFVRKHQDGEFLVVKMDRAERSMRIRADPETYFITDHYENYPWVLVRLEKIEREDLRELLYEAWRSTAPQLFLKKPPRGPQAIDPERGPSR